MKKILALLMAVAMLSMGILAFAEDPGTEQPAPNPPTNAPAYDTKLTINGLDGPSDAVDPVPDDPDTLENEGVPGKPAYPGDTVHFYKVLEWVGDEAQDGDIVASGWKVLKPFDTVIDTVAKLEEIIGKPAVADDPSTPEDETTAAVPGKNIDSDLAGELARAAVNGTSKDISVLKDETSVVYTLEDDEKPGLYMAIVTPGDPDVSYNPVFVSSDFTTEGDTNTNKWDIVDGTPDANGDIPEGALTYADEATVKKSRTTLVKQPGGEPLEWVTVAIGDEVPFTVETIIPGYGDVYESPIFIMRDKLTDLKLKADANNACGFNVNVVEPAGAQYTITATTAGYKIVFDSAYLKTLKVPTPVKVEYTATVSSTAKYNVNLEKNEVSTEYSHNPEDETDHKFKKDDTNHYTFSIDAEGDHSGSSQEGIYWSEIVKVGRKADGTVVTDTKLYSKIDDREYWESPLEGAKFVLYDDKDGKTVHIFKDENGDQLKDQPELISKEDGRFTITGLDAGTYYLKEVSAPNGYIMDDTMHEIVIDAKYVFDDITEYTTDGENWIKQDDYDKLSDEEKAKYKSCTYNMDFLDSYTVMIDGVLTAEYKFTHSAGDSEIVWTEDPKSPIEKPFDIVNTQGIELPNTGGIGTTIFYVAGSIMVLAAAILLVTKRRMNNVDE